MRKTDENDYKEYSSWARENTANSVYPCRDRFDDIKEFEEFSRYYI